MRRCSAALTIVLVVALASTASAASGSGAAAERWFGQYLQGRFGTVSHRYLHCANFFTDDDGLKVGDCWGHFRARHRWHTVIAGVGLDGGGTVGLTGKPFHRSWVRRWHRAGRRCKRQTVAGIALKGKLLSNDGTCDARLAMEVEKGVTFLHGTGTGSFLPVVRYRCHEHGRTQACFNKVGDGFRYTFPRILECGSNVGEGWTMGKARGAGRWNLTTRKVQCPQARGFVDNVKYGRPFRKGVRWTARTRYWGTYHCTYLDLGYEYADIRCTASRGRVLHWQEGA